MKQLVKSVLYATGLLPAVNLYLDGKRRQEPYILKKKQEDRSFYGSFIRPGDLVFDVGANIGDLTELFLDLGATVVAVEPQPYCQRYMELRFKGRKGFFLEKIGLSDRKGNASIHISSAHTLSTLSSEFIEKVTKTGRYGNHRWNKSMDISVDTLDGLILKYGLPAYCKIDVEGYEYQVVKGLHHAVSCISFEFTPELTENSLQAVDVLTGLGDYRFWWAERSEFHDPGKWLGCDNFKNYLRERSRTGVVADIFARLN